MTSKAKETRADVRERILCEATRLFGERGFGGVALRDIAKACDIPLSTLSSHFALKRSLQEVVFQRAVEIIAHAGIDEALQGLAPHAVRPAIDVLDEQLNPGVEIRASTASA
jgi:AcrR family transcriptional regulator